MGLAPAARFLKPSLTIACASTVAVVVPSPATSLVLVATSLSNCAPMFSKGSGRSISRAIVTPSLVIVGAPNFLSSTTLRPFGPSVTLTASASVSIPFLRERRAFSSNCNRFATKHLLGRGRTSPPYSNYFTIPTRASLAVVGWLFHDTHYVAFAENQEFLVVDLDLGT